MPTVTKKAFDKVAKREIENILEKGYKMRFTVPDLNDNRAYAVALYFTGFETRAYRAKCIDLINIASSLPSSDYDFESERLESGSYFYTITKNA